MLTKRKKIKQLKEQEVDGMVFVLLICFMLILATRKHAEMKIYVIPCHGVYRKSNKKQKKIIIIKTVCYER